MKTDVIIVGGNYSGLSLATLLGAAGLSVTVLERGAKKRAKFDGRTLALSFHSMQILEQAGVAKAIKKDACPILDIRVADQGSRVRLDFNHMAVGDQPFGWIVENHLFHHALEARLKTLKHVRVVSLAAAQDLNISLEKAAITLDDGQTFAADLIIGADGRNSWCRKAAHIPTYGWNYRQTAIACVIRHDAPHNNIAVEHFESGGPFATLPMTDDANGRHRSSIIWTEETARADALMKLDEKDFAQRLTDQIEGWLGNAHLAGSRFAYPISLQHARQYTAERLALIGDAAHSIHPIAGQGFNLGMGDIGVLSEEVIRAVRLGLDCGREDVLRRYEKRRKVDNGNMVLMTDGLVRLFSNALPPLQHARRFGLDAVQHMPALKRFFMRTAMGRGKSGQKLTS